MSTRHDVLVIGAGIAGLHAARQALQSGLHTAILEAQLYGGLVLNVNHLDGAIAGAGIDLATGLMTDLEDLGADRIEAGASAIVRDGADLIVESEAGRQRAGAVIIASGARFKRLGIPGEAGFEERGVSHCADCDGPLHQQQDMVVAGGGDSALQEALVLAQFARQVHLVQRGSGFRAQPHLAAQVAAQPNIVVHWRTRIEAVLGAQSVQAVRVHHQDGDTRQDIPCTGLFVYVGLQPAAEFVPAAVLRDPAGFLLTGATLQTAMPGVFAAGAVRAGCGGMLTHAIADGIAAAQAVQVLLRA